MNEEPANKVGLQLGILAALPNLQVLEIHGMVAEYSNEGNDDDDADASRKMEGHMLGCAAIPNLQVLSSRWLYDEGNGSREAFAVMLQRLTSLKSLEMLWFPTPALWELVHARGGHPGLEKLVVGLQEGTNDGLEALASCCVRDFPALKELHIHLVHGTAEPFRALQTLKSHPSLISVNVVACTSLVLMTTRQHLCVL